MDKSSWVHSSTQGLSHHVAGEVLGLLKMVANHRWARWLYLFLIYMLLSEEVTYASNVFETYINVIIWKLCCFPLTGFETQTCTVICEPICNIISTATLCMWCDVDLPRSFVTLGGLPDLYKWKYVRVNVFNVDSRIWSCINWAVLSQTGPVTP